MKKSYTPAELTLVFLQSEDVLTTSLPEGSHDENGWT